MDKEKEDRRVNLYKWRDPEDRRRYRIAFVEKGESILFARCYAARDGCLLPLEPTFGQYTKFSPYDFETLEGPIQMTRAEIRKKYGPVITSTFSG